MGFWKPKQKPAASFQISPFTPGETSLYSQQLGCDEWWLSPQTESVSWNLSLIWNIALEIEIRVLKFFSLSLLSPSVGSFPGLVKDLMLLVIGV